MVIWYERIEIEPKIIKQYKLVQHETESFLPGFSYKYEDYKLIQIPETEWKPAEPVKKQNGKNSKIQIISKDNFEPFQNPCDTNVIISSAHQRKEEMKKHGCYDAREVIPHGKTSLLDGKI